MSQRLTQRSDIQSLRALAILLVVGAHTQVPYLQGGYIGVDVFFVLSGYLISGLVLIEAESARRFDAWRFYARRLKRLLPALLVVLLAVAAVGSLLVGPREQGTNAATGQAATLWLSNFYFAARVINYFSSGTNSNLYLHTWSLSVEEQFYLIWPWLLLFLYGIWNWQGAPMSRKRLAIGLAFVASASLVLGVYWSRTAVDVGFYLMPGRMWEFALGALVFLLREAGDAGRIAWLTRCSGRSLLNTLGYALMLAAAVMYTNELRYPGLWALLPCLGAALVLLDAPEKRPSSRMSRVALRQPVLQFIGDISYSLYLWHWPVLLLGAEVLGHSATTRLGLFALTLALSATTYYGIENPIRRLPFRRPALVLVPSLFGIAFGYLGMAAWSGAAANNLHSRAQVHITMGLFDVPALYNRPDCDTWFHSSRLVPCVSGPEKARYTVVMFGDSALAQWFPAIADIYLKKPDWRLIVLTKSACSASQVSYYYGRIKSSYTVCDAWRRRALDYIVRIRPDLVIMGSTRYGFSSTQWIGGTQSVLNRLSAVSRKVVIMSPTPDLGFNALDCLSAKVSWPRWLPLSRRCQTPLEPASKDRVHTLLEKAAEPYRNVRVIDMRDKVCPDGTCRAQIGSIITYRDNQHLTASFVRSLVPSLRHALQAAGIPE